ncbi:MAG TPA: anthranilate phosphoribosyltransferase [Myxococcaceae bacterium]|nr:anthranilate phosphoribosyltransferase [Myxococcaceae bacterium]
MKALLQKLVDRVDLTPDEVEAAFETIFRGEATPAQMGAFLVAFRMKGETPAEIAAAATVMRRRATPVRLPPGRVVLDTCGTGGDGAGTFNISTAAALVVAGAGVTVAKHGNRSVSSQSGSADLLTACGVQVDAPVEVVERCLAEVRIGFLYAPALHGAMRHVGPVRREVGVRSVFNLLGPLANPARAPRQLLGVYAAHLVPVVAETLARLGTERALVVHGLEGLDEISPSGPTRAAWVEAGQVREVTLRPEDGGLRPVAGGAIRGGTPEDNARLLAGLLDGGDGPLRDAVLLNAGAALWVADAAETLAEGVLRAAESIDSGAARTRLERLVALTRAGVTA